MRDPAIKSPGPLLCRLHSADMSTESFECGRPPAVRVPPAQTWLDRRSQNYLTDVREQHVTTRYFNGWVDADGSGDRNEQMGRP